MCSGMEGGGGGGGGNGGKEKTDDHHYENSITAYLNVPHNI